MRVLLLKTLSLAVSVGTLAYIVIHAGASAGCAARAPEPTPQVARVETKNDPPPAPAATPCRPVYAMPATKAAPVFRPEDDCAPPTAPKAPARQGQAVQQAAP